VTADPFHELEAAPRFTAVRRWRGQGDEFLLGETASTRSLYAAGGDAVHFDLEGRWQRARLGAATFLRGYDGRVLQRLVGAWGEDARVVGVQAVHARVVALVEQAARGAPPSLAAAAGWGVERLVGEGQRFLAAYRPVGVLPPDRYRSVLLQATWGCAHNGCLFCSLYKGQRYRVPGPNDFLAHVRAVKDFLGSGLGDRRGVFLGEANALGAPMEALRAVFDILEVELPELMKGRGPSRGVSSFVDAFTSFRTLSELEELRGRGLTRIFLGVESGDPATLTLLGKPATSAAVRALVRTAQQAGLSVGVTLLVGLGDAHLDATAQLASELGLTEDDVVYLSPLRVAPGGPLAWQLGQRKLTVPSRPEVEREYSRLRAALGGLACQVARYDVGRFIYG
jgi:Radical SAM superfamily